MGYLEKRSKNCVAWKGSEAVLGATIDPQAKQGIDQFRAEIAALAKEEERLDQWLSNLIRSQVVSQSVSTDEIVEAIYYPVGAPVNRLPTKESVVDDETGKPKWVLVAIQAPLGSYAHIVPPSDSDTTASSSRPYRLYVGNEAGLVARHGVPAPPPGSKRQSPFAMTSGRVFKSARRDERGLSVYVMPTFFDDKEQKLKTPGLRLLSDDDPFALAAAATAAADKKGEDEDLVVDPEESKRQRTSSWDVAESMANDEGVSEFFDDDQTHEV